MKSNSCGVQDRKGGIWDFIQKKIFHKEEYLRTEFWNMGLKGRTREVIQKYGWEEIKEDAKEDPCINRMIVMEDVVVKKTWRNSIVY